MKLYFAPLSCSLAVRIALYEAGADEVEFVEVDRVTKQTSDGKDYLSTHPLGMVPALRLDDGTLLTEAAAILQYIAARYPEAELAPRDPLDTALLQQWLSFVGGELHKTIFYPFFDWTSSEAAKSYALSKVELRLAWLEKEISGREFLLERFSVADTFLITVLNWTAVTPIDLKARPTLRSYLKRMNSRPHVARARAEEREIYLKQLERNGQLDSPIGRALRPRANVASP